MEQTAVKWLEDNLIFEPWAEEHFKHNNECWNKAKEMEKEQAKRMYSEEDMEEAFTNGLNRAFDSDFDRWFEQFKKK